MQLLQKGQILVRIKTKSRRKKAGKALRNCKTLLSAANLFYRPSKHTIIAPASTTTENDGQSTNNPSFNRLVSAVMPHPGQPGALYFDGKGISEFFNRWESECDEFGPEVKSTAKLMDGYLQGNRMEMRRDMKAVFWQRDTHKFNLNTLRNW